MNLLKSAAIPIRCSEDDVAAVRSTPNCQVGSFPCKYLGLPLTLRKQRASQLSYLVDLLAAHLPSWRASTLPKSGRLLLVQSVLCAIPIHAMMALDIPQKTLLAMTKICRGFLWCGSDKANGGSCAVAWDTACTPKWAGGLGLPDLGWLNCAMQAHWPWLQRSDPLRPWNEFQIKVPKESMDLFRAAAHTTIGDGNTALFWEDRWLQGYRVQELALGIYNAIPKRIRKTKTVKEALGQESWTHDFGLELTVEQLLELFEVWDRTALVQLNSEHPDEISWAWEKGGHFSTCSAYAAKFWGREVSPTASFTCKSRALLRCKFFSWLAVKNRCWTSDRLARRGLPHHDKCPFCEQDDETINHILLQCVFSRQVWMVLTVAMDSPTCMPTQHDTLTEWCTRRNEGRLSDKDSRTILTLGLWTLWKHRNSIVFDNATPSMSTLR